MVTETAPSKEPQQSWRARPVESGAAAPTTSSKGELQMADQVGHDAVAAGPSWCDREVEAGPGGRVRVPDVLHAVMTCAVHP